MTTAKLLEMVTRIIASISFGTNLLLYQTLLMIEQWIIFYVFAHFPFRQNTECYSRPNWTRTQIVL